ncbi:MAG: rRNA maturation RNase YbeY [Clostridia bacterium]|nr:rRNA maturation RNase YbeY [Clostridia bacterium]
MSAQIELLTECDVPEGARAWIETAMKEAAERLGAFSCTVLLTTEDEIQRLNREFRGIDQVTDVLSFPSRDADGPPEPDGFAGDIAVCVTRAAEQAEALAQPLEQELAFLCVHGALHLNGWDHEQETEAEEMYAMQREIMRDVLARFGDGT